jgi:hypothetical protein
MSKIISFMTQVYNTFVCIQSVDFEVKKEMIIWEGPFSIWLGLSFIVT